MGSSLGLGILMTVVATTGPGATSAGGALSAHVGAALTGSTVLLSAALAPHWSVALLAHPLRVIRPRCRGRSLAARAERTLSRDASSRTPEG